MSFNTMTSPLTAILASTNEHKIEELNQLLGSETINVVAPSEKLSVIEDGDSFQENALKKAQAYYDKFQGPVISDDSGLIVHALPNELGIKTARFGGEGLSDPERATLLVEKMSEFKEADQRTAYFSCVLCLYLSPKEIFFFEGRLNGRISEEYRGEAGFGYDPVFIPLDTKNDESEKTLAEIPDWKEKNSHRAISSALLGKFLKESNCQSP
jgi:XTP/dITP diphosphohydrolase